MAMLQSNKDCHSLHRLSKLSSISCSDLSESRNNLHCINHSKSFKVDRSSTNRLFQNSAHSFSKQQQRQCLKINPSSLMHQKSLLRKNTPNNKIRKSFEYEDKSVNTIKRNFSKFQEQFKYQMIRNDDPIDLLTDKESTQTEEAIMLVRKKLEQNNLTLVPSGHLIDCNNNNIEKKNVFVNKYCIVSRQGTIRGTLNHVKDSIKQLFKVPRITNPAVNVHLNTSSYNIQRSQANLNETNQRKIHPINETDNTRLYLPLYNLLARDYEKEECDKIVIYTTSLQVVRLAYDKCKRVKKILQSHCVKYEERDLYKKKEYQHELQFRLDLDEVDLPHIFFNGTHIGNCDQIELYSDQGLLRKLFKDLEKIKLKIFCEKCNGYRFVLCNLCNGGKKKYNNFANLKCTHCNEDGLIRCDFCVEQQLI